MNNKDDPHDRFEQLLEQERELIRQLKHPTEEHPELLKELSRLQRRRAEIGKKLNIRIIGQ